MPDEHSQAQDRTRDLARAALRDAYLGLAAEDVLTAAIGDHTRALRASGATSARALVAIKDLVRETRPAGATEPAARALNERAVRCAIGSYFDA